MLTALFVSMGDRPDRCRRSVEDGWRQLSGPDKESGPE
jgi:hypothetical protein